MSGDFIDSNVIVYLFDQTDDRKRYLADGIILGALESGVGAISWQVVQEVLNVVTTKTDSPMSAANVQELLDDVLLPLWRVGPSAPIYRRALEIRWRYGFRFYDSLIVAAALEADSDRLLTEDLNHGQQIDGMRIENPFGQA